MLRYEFYFLTNENHIVNGLLYKGEDDLCAVREAQAHANGQVIDIWQGCRRVAMVKKGYAPLVFNDHRAV